MSPSAASFSRVEGPTATAASDFSASPPWSLSCFSAIAGQERSALGVDRAAIDEDLGQGLPLGPRPGAEGGDELVLVDQADLQREQPEEQVARRLVASGHGVGPVRSSGGGSLPGGVSNSTEFGGVLSSSFALLKGIC